VTLTPAGTATPVADASTGPGSPSDGTIVFDTTGLDQGTYELALLDGEDAELARDTVVLVAAGQPPILTLADDTLRGDQALEITWAFAPGNRFDWFGVFRAGLTAKTGSIKAWRYLEGRVGGSLDMGAGVRGAADWPLPAGEYRLHLCLDDSYRCRVSVPFSVLG
jgi:hypothetical protein